MLMTSGSEYSETGTPVCAERFDPFVGSKWRRTVVLSNQQKREKIAYKKSERKRNRQRDRERGREGQRERQGQRETYRQTETEREREREGQRESETGTERDI